MDNDRCDTCNSELVDYGTPKGIDCPLCLMRERAERAEAERDAARAELATAREGVAKLSEQVSTLAALVRLKYGNLDQDVNSVLAECGYGWKP